MDDKGSRSAVSRIGRRESMAQRLEAKRKSPKRARFCEDNMSSKCKRSKTNEKSSGHPILTSGSTEPNLEEDCRGSAESAVRVSKVDKRKPMHPKPKMKNAKPKRAEFRVDARKSKSARSETEAVKSNLI